MARKQDAELDEDELAEGEEEGEETQGDQPFLYSVTGQTPWWIVSVLLHVLVILLASLVSMAIELPKGEDQVVMVTELAQRSEERRVGKECRSRWAPNHEKKNTNRKTSGRYLMSDLPGVGVIRTSIQDVLHAGA